MAVFRRRPVAPSLQGKRYGRFRAEVRRDFVACCAFCLLHELLAGGRHNFELDHFRPKSLPHFAHLINDFFNLFYACHPCNKLKANCWPPDELLSQGYRFVDFTQDTFSEHFLETGYGRWLPLSKPARYTERRLRLNRRHLLEIRSLLREIAELRGIPHIDWNRPCRDQVPAVLPH